METNHKYEVGDRVTYLGRKGIVINGDGILIKVDHESRLYESRLAFQILYYHSHQLELDIQYYRSERLNKLLNK